MEQPLGSISLAEFLLWEQTQPERHELIHGQIVTYADGGSLDHDDIIANVHYTLRERVLPPCKAHGSNVTLETISRTDAESGFRADVVVSCSQENYGKALLVRQPRIVVEVLSPSNVGRKWNAKLFEYWNTPSIEQFVTIDSAERAVESFVRGERGIWRPAIEIIGEGVLEFPSVNARMGLDEIYRLTTLAFI